MSYPLLLLILSVIVIVPTVFVVKGKSKQKLLANQNQNQARLGHSRSATNSNSVKPSAEQLQIASGIDHYRQHPALPISFRQLLGKIHAQYVTLNGVKLAPDQRFTVDKLASTRLTEIIEDYLKLDADYAENTIIDNENNLTSQDVTYAQLASMLDFMMRTQQDGQAQVASNILANRSYLQSVYGEFHQGEEAGTRQELIKAPEHTVLDESDSLTPQSLIERGESYLADCDKAQPSQMALAQYSTVLDESLLKQLGTLTYTAERTVTYSDALLSDAINLTAFDQIIADALPALLRTALSEYNTQYDIADDSESTSLPVLSSNQQQLLQQKITRVQQLLDDCLSRLERTAKQQYETGTLPKDSIQSLQNTLKSKAAQAQYLLDSGFFKI